MRITAPRVAFSSVVLTAGLMTGILVKHQSRKPPAATQGAPLPTGTVVQPSASPSQSVLSGSSGPTPRSSEPVLKPTDTELQKRLVGFITAYYTLKHTDTEEDRRSRVAPYVAEEVLDFMDFGLSVGTAANDARVKNRITISGKVLSGEIQAKPASWNKSVMLVTVPVTVSSVNPSGKVVSRFKLQTATQWWNADGVWYVMNFREGGDTE